MPRARARQPGFRAARDDEFPRRCEAPIAAWESRRAELEGGGAIGTGRSDVYGADIIRACETGEPFSFNGNVPNRCGDALLIDNLPADCCVEVPYVASAGGVERSRPARSRASSPRSCRPMSTYRG